MGRPDDIGVGRYPQKLRRTVLTRARSVGIAGEIEAMQLALAACIGVYDQILATVPDHIKPIVSGAGGKVMKVARDILEAV